MIINGHALSFIKKIKIMEVILIIAVAENGVIGVNGDLPWHLPDDMKHFRDTTTGHVVVMGRKNWESIPEKYRPLSNRMNIVMTRNIDYIAEGADIAESLESAIAMAKSYGKEKVFIIGGAEIYKLALEANVVDSAIVTEVFTSNIEGNTRFHIWEYMTGWDEMNREIHLADDKHKYTFDIVVYKKE